MTGKISEAFEELISALNAAAPADFRVIDSIGNPEASAREHEALILSLSAMDAAIAAFEKKVAQAAYEAGAFEAHAVARDRSTTLDLFDDLKAACRERAEHLREEAVEA